MALEVRSGAIEKVSIENGIGRGGTKSALFSVNGIWCKYEGECSYIRERNEVALAGKMQRNGIFRVYSIYFKSSDLLIFESTLWQFFAALAIAFFHINL